MNKVLPAVLLVGLILGTAYSAPIISFGPGSHTPGNWSYDGINTLTFTQGVTVDQGAGSTSDTLVGSGALVYVPDMVVGGIPGGPYTMTPAGRTFEIKSSDGLTTYLSGTLVSSDLVAVGTGALAYTEFGVDIINVTVNNTIGSTALSLIAQSTKSLDFYLALSGTNQNFDYMLDNNLKGDGDFSGVMSMIIPEPCTLLLLGFGCQAL